MYNGKYNNFQKDEFEYSYPISFSNDNKFDYMEGQQKPTYSFNYEDTVSLPFLIDKKFQDYEIQITVSNFRHEEVYFTSAWPDCCNKVCLDIDYETSSKVFKPGIYYCKLQAVKHEFNPSTGLDDPDVSTLVQFEDCSILVK